MSYRTKDKSKGNWGLYKIIILFAIGFGITIFISIMFENVPKNYETVTKDFKYGVILVTKEKTFTIPVWNTLIDAKSTITVYFYPNVTGVYIESVRLSSPSDSILDYDENFTHNKTLPQLSKYILEISASHKGEIINSSEIYNIDIHYFKGNNYKLPQYYNIGLHSFKDKGNNSTLSHYDISFPWNIKTKDMTSITYFWIVLIGVVTGRLITIVQKHTGTIDLDRQDILWIILGIITGVFAFTGFINEIKFSSNIVINIITALVFGLGTEKILEVARRFPKEDNTQGGGKQDRGTQGGGTQVGAMRFVL